MDVSKRDFVPCPKVDSSVVIIRPKAEIPEVNLDEWWGFTRACFGKKNRTLGATFKQKKKVMELLRLSKKIGPNSESIVNADSSDCNEDDDDDESAVFMKIVIHLLARKQKRFCSRKRLLRSTIKWVRGQKAIKAV
ncbi:hypothetical protein Dsin_011250 [Dipteronia sinensis]|uniref:rRNA adenine N(6)-methyltransferase n=1 Tax=Dipteronia sinensis TaxID=43782 RepID=A0AAE0AUP5_9ROSI|nr:hypothetical protein Dsin_011250 [Dipteronia sinensis]